MPVESGKKTRDERRSILARQIAALIAQGRRIESQNDYQAVLVRGHHLWEAREIVSVDEWGNISVQRLGIEKERLAIAIGALCVLLVLIIIGALH